jgi:hypothetical protein
MLARIAAGVVVVGVVPVALWVTGLLPIPEARSDVVAYESRTTSEEAAWRDHVGAICGWERKQGRALERAFRRASSPVDVELLFKEGLRLGDESLGIFKRLHTPLEYERETRTLERLFREEHRNLERAIEAFKHRRRAAFVRAIRRFAAADVKSTRLLVQLGVHACGNVKPVTLPQGQRERIV